MTAQVLLCAWCSFDMSIPAVKVVVVPGPGHDDDRDLSYGVEVGTALIEAARTVRDDGGRVVINNQANAGVYGTIMFQGTSVCTAHLWRAVELARNPRPGSAW